MPSDRPGPITFKTSVNDGICMLSNRVCKVGRDRKDKKKVENDEEDEEDNSSIDTAPARSNEGILSTRKEEGV
jgi:hypothetical protein